MGVNSEGNISPTDAWVFSPLAQETDPLPDKYSPLRYEQPLAQFCVVRYKQCGKRLANFTTGANDAPIGYFEVDGDLVKCLVPLAMDAGVEPQLRLQALTTATDWQIVDNDSHTARLVSATESMEIGLLLRFQKRFGDSILPPESGAWSVPDDLVPASAKLELPADRLAITSTPPAKRSKRGATASPAPAPSPQGPAPVCDAAGTASPAPPSGNGRAVARRPPAANSASSRGPRVS